MFKIRGTSKANVTIRTICDPVSPIFMVRTFNKGCVLLLCPVWAYTTDRGVHSLALLEVTFHWVEVEDIQILKAALLNYTPGRALEHLEMLQSAWIDSLEV